MDDEGKILLGFLAVVVLLFLGQIWSYIFYG